MVIDKKYSKVRKCKEKEMFETFCLNSRVPWINLLINKWSIISIIKVLHQRQKQKNIVSEMDRIWNTEKNRDNHK